jgi:hypothetical protein
MNYIASKQKNIRQLLDLGQDYFKSATILLSEGHYRDSVPLLISTSQQSVAVDKALASDQVKSRNLKKNKKLDLRLLDKQLSALQKATQKNNNLFPEEKTKELNKIIDDVDNVLYELEKSYHDLFPWRLSDQISPNIYTSLVTVSHFICPKILRDFVTLLWQKSLNKIALIYIVVSIIVAAGLLRFGYVHYKQTYHGSAVPGLYGVYYGHTDFSGFTAGRIDGTFDFMWWNGTSFFKERTDNTENASIRWTGKIVIPETGIYHFYVNSDDSSSLAIDKKQIIEVKPWTKSGDENAVHSSVFLEKGVHPIKIEYVQYGGTKFLLIKWRKPADTAPAVLDGQYLRTI